MHFLENLFSVEKQENRKIVRILGLKIKLKRKKGQISGKIFFNPKELFASQVCFDNYAGQYTPAGTFNRLDVIVRYLAIEEYYGLNDYGFNLYEKMQAARCGSEHVSTSIDNFKKLIKSFAENGYDTGSKIVLNNAFQLLDGSHRLALALYHNIEKISCVLNPKSWKNLGGGSPLYSSAWFIENGFSLDELAIIFNKFDELYAKTSEGIFLILWSPAQDYFEEITQKLQMIYRIENIADYEFSDIIYEKIVKGIYYIDDIEDWKIDKKIEYMKSDRPKKIRIMKIFFKYPKFRLKAKSRKSISVDGEIVKKMIRNAYKGKIENYFYDIIIHTADNYEQSEFIGNLFLVNLPLKEYFDKISNFNYMLIKTETDYMPKDFPISFPFSKDEDIICSRNDFEALSDFTYKFFKENISKNLSIRKVEKNNRCKIRIEMDGFLINQLDISYKIDGLKDEFTEKALSNKIKIKNYFVSDVKDEVYIRQNEYENKPDKQYHKLYVEKNQILFDSEIFESLKETKND